MLQKQTPVLPSFITLPRDFAAHDGMPWELWWIATDLHADGRNLGVQALFIQLDDQMVALSLSIVDFDSGLTWSKTDQYEMASVTISTDRLDVRTPLADLSMTPSGDLRFTSAIDGASKVDLTLQPTSPVLHNCGTGSFPFSGGRTWQYSAPALAVAGAVSFEGSTLAVTGGGWLDRQWCDPATDLVTLQFTWLGICLENGTNISVWDTTIGGTPQGQAWATIVSQDGAHTIVPMEPVAQGASGTLVSRAGNRYPAGWTVRIPKADAVLEITHAQLFERSARPFYQGALKVTGLYNSAAVCGYGFCDLVGWTDA